MATQRSRRGGSRAPRGRGRRAALQARAKVRRRRRRAATGLSVVALGAFAAGLSQGAGSPEADRAAPQEDPGEERAELPRGGTELLPAYRLVGYYGAPQDPQLGALGKGTPEQASAALARQAAGYRGRRPLQPFLELLATIAAAHPGADGLYRIQQPREVIDDYLEQARADRSLLVLDIQPGRADVSDEIERLGPYLRQPDVGLGLDPEWRVGPGEVPGQVIGSMTAAEVNGIAARLSRVVRANDLPQKLLIVHRFVDEMITDPDRLRSYPGVATVLNVDGFGTPAQKRAKYRDLHAERGSGLFSGFKLFYEEDTDLMQPRAVLGLRPRPDLVMYE